MVAEQEIVMEAERNQKIEIEKLEESRNLAQKEMEKLQISLKDSNEELGQAKMRMDSAIAEKEAALNQINSMKEHLKVRYHFEGLLYGYLVKLDDHNSSIKAEGQWG